MDFIEDSKSYGESFGALHHGFRTLIKRGEIHHLTLLSFMGKKYESRYGKV
jgi:hypothetical protein